MDEKGEWYAADRAVDRQVARSERGAKLYYGLQEILRRVSSWVIERNCEEVRPNAVRQVLSAICLAEEEVQGRRVSRVSGSAAASDRSRTCLSNGQRRPPCRLGRGKGKGLLLCAEYCVRYRRT